MLNLFFKIKRRKTDNIIRNKKTIKEIWQIEKISDFLSALSEYINEKCHYGERISLLSKPEKVFYITQSLEMEVNNGGFSQFFFNFSGNFSNELTETFYEIGAKKTAEICQKAIAILQKDIPLDRDERVKMLKKYESQEIRKVWEECDKEFYEYQEDLKNLSYEYVQKNKIFFQ